MFLEQHCAMWWMKNSHHFFDVNREWPLSRRTVAKNQPASAGDIRDVGSVPRLGRSPEGGHDNSLQYSCVKNSVDRGAWWVLVHGVTKNWTQMRQLSTAQKDVFVSVVINKYSYFPRTWYQADCLVFTCVISFQVLDNTSVQFSCSVVSESLRPHALQHSRLPCPSPTPGAYSNSCPLSQFELTQTHAIQPSHPRLSPSPPAFNLSQNQGLF